MILLKMTEVGKTLEDKSWEISGHYIPIYNLQYTQTLL